MSDLGPMERAVAFALKNTADDKRDTGARALARKYAHLIDQADSDESSLIAALAKISASLPDDDGLADDLARIARQLRAVTAATVVNDLGPKLLAALSALGMTPASRGQGQEAPTRGNPVGNTLTLIRGDRAQQRARPN